MPGLRALAPLPAVFPKKQLVFKAKEFVQTQNDRPGRGTRHRLAQSGPLRWIGISAHPEMAIDDAKGLITHYRDLDYVQWKAEGDRILRFNNKAEFCAWAKGERVVGVDFIDLGIHAGKDDCTAELAHYLRTQHPDQDEGSPGAADGSSGIVDPFAGRPADAMYGDQMQLDLTMQVQEARDDGTVRWVRLPAGGTQEGGGRVAFELKVANQDILPLKVLDAWIGVYAQDRSGTGATTGVARLNLGPEDDLPDTVAAGAALTLGFDDVSTMHDVYGKLIRVHMVVEYEDPWGERAVKRAETHYWKGHY